MLRYLCLGFAIALVACGDDPEPPGLEDFGEVTALVVLVNPIVNEGSSTAVQIGEARAGIDVAIEGGAATETDGSGLAYLRDIGGPGPKTLEVADTTITFEVAGDKELYDWALSTSGDRLAELFPIVRYPIGGQVLELEPGTSLDEAIDADDLIVLLKAGRYPGGLELREEGVLIFGAWSPTEGPLSIIEGDVRVFGGGNRIRGVTVDGGLSSSANDFSLAFSSVSGMVNVSGNGVSLLRNAFPAGRATVPSSNSVLVDNDGLPPR